MKAVYLLQNHGVASRTPAGWEVARVTSRADARYTEAELAELADADVLVVGLEPVTADLLARGARLKLVQRLGVGYDNVDLEAAASRGVAVANLPDFNATTVAEHAVMFMLALLRRVVDATLAMKTGQWPLAALVTRGNFDLQGRTVGILGLGAIGRAVAERLRPFAVDAVYYDNTPPSGAVEADLGVRFVPLDELLRVSDVVTIHLPLTPATRGLIGRRELEAMKRSAILVNTARGAIVDEDALVDALQRGEIAGAGLDVFSDEPLSRDHRLRRCPNIVVTPHAAGQTREAMERMAAALVHNLERVARGEPPLHAVVGPGS